jgi:quercetin dioxygenase-like cupin family protein
MHATTLGMVALAGIALATVAVTKLAAQSQPPNPASSAQLEVKRTVLFKGDLEGAEGKEIVVFVAELAPGAVGAKHYHPGPEFFYVLEGTLAHEPEGGPAHIMKIGDFGSNPNKSVHTIRNPSSTERAKAIDFLLADKGQPLVIPVK